MGEFTHFNEQGHAVMVDVSEKADTMRPGNCKDCRDHGGEENIRADPVVPYPEPEQGYSGI